MKDGSIICSMIAPRKERSELRQDRFLVRLLSSVLTLPKNLLNMSWVSIVSKLGSSYIITPIFIVANIPQKGPSIFAKRGIRPQVRAQQPPPIQPDFQTQNYIAAYNQELEQQSNQRA